MEISEFVGNVVLGFAMGFVVLVIVVAVAVARAIWGHGPHH
jgi:hypothetical protein